MYRFESKLPENKLPWFSVELSEIVLVMLHNVMRHDQINVACSTEIKIPRSLYEMPVPALPWLLSNNFHSIIMKHVIGANDPVIEAFYVVLNWFEMSVYFIQFGSVKYNYSLLQEYFAPLTSVLFY